MTAPPPGGDERLPVTRASELDACVPEARWLVRPLWGRAAVGVIGGQPKLGKSWLGLHLAVSVASGAPCLDRFPVENPGPALVYLAEEALPMVRARIEALCQHLSLDIAALDLHVITAPALRLDVERDQERLATTVDALRPALLVLDPLIRLHRCEENSSTELSALLGYLRRLQRTFDLAVCLVHHLSKKTRARPGQALRGSSDLHGWLDCGAYLARDRDDQLFLTLEHRSAPAPEPIALNLVSASDGSATHLEVVGPDASALEAGATPSLQERVLGTLRQAPGPLPRAALRDRLRVQNKRLGDVLGQLQADGAIARSAAGWKLVR